MSKKEKHQLSFDENIYTNPAAENSVAKHVQAKPVAKAKAEKAPAASVQPFLPGLSRRGRPRSKNPVPATVRATESRKRRIEAGVRRVELFLSPEIATDLDLLTDHYKISRAEVISRLIAKSAKRVRQMAGLSAGSSGRHSTS